MLRQNSTDAYNVWSRVEHSCMCMSSKIDIHNVSIILYRILFGDLISQVDLLSKIEDAMTHRKLIHNTLPVHSIFRPGIFGLSYVLL